MKSLIATLVLVTATAFAQSRPLATAEQVHTIYTQLLPQIEKIPIFDHHAHPGFPDDSDVDAMASPPGSVPLRERDSNPELVAAAKALFNFPYADLSPEHAKWLDQKDDELRRQWGKDYLTKILDKVGIQVSVANRVAMDYLENNPRFRFVFFVDPYMFPFDNSKLAISPDRQPP